MDVLSLAESGAMCVPFLLLSVLMPLSLPGKTMMPKGFSDEDFRFCKYLKCVQVAGCRTMQDVVRKMYASRCLRTRNGTMTIRHFNMRANVDQYFGEMDYALDVNIMEEDFDITFANRIMRERHICGQLFDKFNNDWQDKITYIVKQRNKVCHNYGTPGNDFQTKVATLKSYVSKIYKEASKVLKVDFGDNSQEVTNLLDAIMRAEIMDDIASSFPGDLEKLKKSKLFKLLNDGSLELHDYYDKLKTLSPCTWIDECAEAKRFNLEKIFTPPKLWDDKYSGNIPMEELLIVKMKKQEIPNLLLIKGLAGSGKTSLCRYFAHSWSKKMNHIKSLEDFDLVLLIEIRRSNAENILQYLREELLSDTCRDFKSEDIIPLLQELDLLFIIDGYDEESDKARALVEDIFENFHSQRIILTTRLDYQEDIKVIAKKWKIQLLSITLKGFDDRKQKDFSKKVFQAMNKCSDNFCMYLDGRGRVLDEHLTLPLTISLLIVLWMENPMIVNRITTATCLYYEIFSLYQKKLVERLITNLKGRGVEILREKVPSLLLYLGEQAWSILQKGSGCELTQDLMKELERRCEAKGIDKVEFLSAFLMCESDYSAPENKMAAASNLDQLNKKYFFLHRTQMEYLASEFLAESIRTGSLDLRKIGQQVLDWRRYSEVLVYLIGNMAKKNILKGKESEILRLAEKTGTELNRYCYWWKLVSESQIDADIPDSPDKPIRYKTVKHPKIAETIEREYLSRDTEWTLGADDVAAGLRLMSLVNPIQLLATSLVINIPIGIDPFKIPDFFDAVTAVHYHQEQKKKKFKVRVKLYLRDHDVCGRERTSDQFLNALNGWADLNHFTGGLSEVANFSNKSTPYLRNLRCLVTSPQVLKSFVNISDTVTHLRLTLAFSPLTCSPDSIMELNFNGDLELFLPNMRDEHLNWLINVVRRLSRNDLKNLHLHHSELTYTSLVQLVKSMNGRLRHTLYVAPPEWQNNSQENKLHEKAQFVIDWLE